MKKICFLLLASLLLMLTACGRNSALNNTDADIPSSMEYSWEYSYFIDDIMRDCTNIVKAKLTSIEESSGTDGFYCFDIDEDYTGNTPDEIHMEYNVVPHMDDIYSIYVVGHTYYLFLCAGEDALYPHTTYHHDFAVDADDATTNTHIMDNDLVITTGNISEHIKDLIASGIVGEDVDETIVSDSNDIMFISDSADIIAEIGVSTETNYNIYTSSYDIKVVSFLKGSTLKGAAESVSSSIYLPPNLDPSKTYYVFLKKIPNGGEGAYGLFSRAYPVIDAASVNAKDLITN